MTPLARLAGYSVAGVDPSIMGIGPVYAIRNLLTKTGMKLEDIDLVEVRKPEIYFAALNRNFYWLIK